MSHSENYQDTGHTTAFYQGVTAERERILALLEDNRHLGTISTVFSEHVHDITQDFIELIEDSVK